MSQNCPICNEPYIISCRCPRSDRKCKNGHEWHTCVKHKTIVLGKSNHSLDGNACTCINGKTYKQIYELIAFDEDPNVTNLLLMKDKETIHLNWSEEGGGEIIKQKDMWMLWEVPQYGGIPSFVKAYKKDELKELLDIVNSWT